MASEGSARRVLYERGVVSLAAPLVAAMLASFTTACVVPPERNAQEADLNAPPEYDLRSARPPAGRIDMPTDQVNCQILRVGVDSIVDDNDDLLRFRWVANNDRPNTRIVLDVQSQSDPGVPRGAEVRVVPSTDFSDEWLLGQEPGGTGVGILSLFITDAPEWQVRSVDPQNTDAIDLSRPTDDGSDGGPPAYGVIEVRWAVVFREGVEVCPQ